MKKLLTGFAGFLLLWGCKEHERTEEAVNMMVSSPAMTMAPVQTGAFENSINKPDYEQKIIKTADLAFETANLDETAAHIHNAAKQFNGLIQHDSENKDSYRLTHNITVRIPSKDFEGFIAEISKGVTYFDRKEISAQDVTDEYIDLEARIKAKKTLEARYLELLKKAAKVSEMLEIEKELSAIREEIESQEGRLRYLKSKVSLSTVNIGFYKTTEVQEGATVSYGGKMWNAVKSGFNGISSFFIGVLYFWPFILIFVIVFVLVRRKMRKKKNL